MIKTFKEYLKETEEKLEEIVSILEGMEFEEINEFGQYIYTEFLDDLPEDNNDAFEIEDITAMVSALGEEFYTEILNMLELSAQEPDETNEGVSRILKNTNKNKKARKFVANSKADLRKTAAVRKRGNRENKSKNKRYFRANKNKIASYQKSRSAAIKKGTHKVKKRRSA